MSTVVIPPGYSPPYAIVTSQDHTGWILIATSLGMVYSVVFAVMRGFVCFTTGRGFGSDDAVLCAATVVAVVQSTVVLKACSIGVGKSFQHIPGMHQDTVLQYLYSSDLLFVTAIGLSKISVAILVLQLTPSQPLRRIHHIGIGLVVVWLVVSLFALAFKCDISHPWLLVGEQCPGVLLRWQIISAFDILSEVAILYGILQLIWRLRITLQNKIAVAATFAFRLLMIVPIVYRLCTFSPRGLVTDPTLLEDRFLVWTQVGLHYSLVSASIPCLRPVITRLTTHYGALGPSEFSIGYGRRGGSQLVSSGIYKLSDLRPGPTVSEKPADPGRCSVVDQEQKLRQFDFDVQNHSCEQEAEDDIQQREKR